MLYVFTIRKIPCLSANWTACTEVADHVSCNWDDGSIGDGEIQVHVDVASQCGITVENLFDVNTGNIGTYNQFKHILELLQNQALFF